MNDVKPTFGILFVLVLVGFAHPYLQAPDRGRCLLGEILVQKPEGWSCLPDLSFKWSTRPYLKQDEHLGSWGQERVAVPAHQAYPAYQTKPPYPAYPSHQTNPSNPTYQSNPAPVFGFDQGWDPEPHRTTPAPGLQNVQQDPWDFR